MLGAEQAVDHRWRWRRARPSSIGRVAVDRLHRARDGLVLHARAAIDLRRLDLPVGHVARASADVRQTGLTGGRLRRGGGDAALVGGAHGPVELAALELAELELRVGEERSVGLVGLEQLSAQASMKSP
jgi:hypothetical protein